MRRCLARSSARGLVVTTTLLYMRNREQSETSETRPGLVALQTARNLERAAGVRERGIGIAFPEMRLGTEVQRAANEALRRLKETDEIAVMTYQDNVELIQEFTRDRNQIENALARIPKKDEWADHCLNKAFAKAADYMVSAGNPVGRRVIIAITGITKNFDCGHGPSGKSARQSLYESGSVVCGLIPKTTVQGMENKYMRWGTRMAGVFGARTMDIKELAEETGGEVMEEKPERLDKTDSGIPCRLPQTAGRYP